MLKAMSANLPKFRLTAYQYPKQFSAELQHELKCLHTLRKKYKHYQHLTTWIVLIMWKLNIDSTKSNYEANLIHSLPITIIPKFMIIYRVLQRPKILPHYLILIHPSLQLMLIKLCFTTI